MTSRRGRGWPLWLVLVLLVLMHFYVRPRLYSGPGAPDFLLIALVIYSLRSRPGPAAVAGFITGIATDLLVPVRLGAGALAHTLVGYGTSWGRSVFFPDNLLVNGGMFGLGVLLRNAVLLLLSGSGPAGLLQALAPGSLLQALTTAAAGTLVTLVIRHRVDFRLDE